MNDFEHLPEDLQDIARALAVHRDVPDGHLLERVLARVKSAPRPRRGFAGFFRARLAALSMLVLCLGLNVTGALAAVLQSLGVSSGTANSLNLSNIINSLTQTVSTGSNWQSAADNVYCDEHGKSGSDDNSSGGSEDNGHFSAPAINANGTKNSADSEKNGGSEENSGGGGNGQCCPTGTGGGGGGDTTDQNGQMSTTNGTKSDSEKNGGTEDNNGGGNGQCCPTSSGSGGSGGGSENNMSPMSNVVTSPTTTSGSGKSKVTTYTKTTTTTTPMNDGGSGGSENNSGGGQCGCPPSTSSGSEQNGGSEKVDTKVDTYTNNTLSKSTTTTTFTSKDESGSENNNGNCPPPPEKPGCGNEQQAGLSGASGVHGGQPPKLEERGSCPHQTGVEGPPGYNG